MRHGEVSRGRIRPATSGAVVASSGRTTPARGRGRPPLLRPATGHPTATMPTQRAPRPATTNAGRRREPIVFPVRTSTPARRRARARRGKGGRRGQQGERLLLAPPGSTAVGALLRPSSDSLDMFDTTDNDPDVAVQSHGLGSTMGSTYSSIPTTPVRVEPPRWAVRQDSQGALQIEEPYLKALMMKVRVDPTHAPANIHVPAQHHTTQHHTTQHNTTQHNTTQHNTTQHSTTQHNATGQERHGLTMCAGRVLVLLCSACRTKCLMQDLCSTKLTLAVPQTLRTRVRAPLCRTLAHPRPCTDPYHAPRCPHPTPATASPPVLVPALGSTTVVPVAPVAPC